MDDEGPAWEGPSGDRTFAERVFLEIRRISPSSLTRMLRASGVLPVGSVESVRQQAEKETHYSGSWRLSLTYDSDAPKGMPRNLFLKTGEGNEEYYFYKHIAPALGFPVAPSCYGGQLPADGSDLYVVLLEDLAGYSTPSIGSDTNWPDPATARAIGWAFAEVHSRCWGDWSDSVDSRGRREFKPHTAGCSGIDAEMFRASAGIRPTTAVLEKYCDISADDLETFLNFMGDRLTQKDRDSFQIVRETFPRLLIERLTTWQALTYSHRDTNVWNVMVAGSVKIVDWANLRVWTGPDDLASHICRYWAPDARKALEQEVFDLYFDRLMERGVEGYGRKLAWKDYRLGVVEQFYKRAWRGRYANWDDEGFWISQNVIEAYHDLRCDELLG